MYLHTLGLRQVSAIETVKQMIARKAPKALNMTSCIHAGGGGGGGGVGIGNATGAIVALGAEVE